MVKKLLLYIGLAILVFSVTYFSHAAILSSFGVKHPYDLRSIYIFQVLVSLTLVISFELLVSFTDQYKDQLGFLYLGFMAVKIMLFCIIFREVLFYSVVLTKVDSLSLLVPIFIFIFYEVLIIVKILNRTT